MSTFDLGGANDAQKEAILATEGPVLMIAGPGTGKTFTLVKRISYLVREKGVRPCEIMVVTFTEKAGKELLTRISNELVDLNLNLNEMYIGTFHSVCLRLLKEYSEYAEEEGQCRVLDAFEQTYLVCRNISSFNRFGGFRHHIPVKSPWKQSLEICRYVSQMMEELADIDAMEADADEDMRFLAKLVRRYQELLARNNAMDFSSIQTRTYDMMRQNPEALARIQESIRYVMVDEYQDTNYVQEQIVLLIAGSRENICVVGDDDQGMYRFRGATIRNILEFPGKFDACRVIHLDTNYRSEPGIVAFYSRWMENADGVNLFNWDKYRYEKKLVAGKKPLLPGASVYACGGDSIEAEKEELLKLVRGLKERGNISDYNQVAFLFRSVKSEEARAVGAWLEENGVPVYSPRSDLFFQRREVRQLLGCVIMCFESYMMDLKENLFLHAIGDGLRRYYIGCLKAAFALAKADAGLMRCIDGIKDAVKGLSGESSLDLGLLDIFYRLIAYRPFREDLKASLLDNVTKSRAARNLSELSRMLGRYSFLHGMHQISAGNKLAMPEELFNIYFKYMIEDGVGEYEDESEYAPSGCVSFLTIHQSKGLEFPAVVVGSLGNAPRRNSDPLLYSAESRFFHRPPFEPIADIKFFDFWRLYYTAFSRAQNMLVLAAKKTDGKYFGEYLRQLPDVRSFAGEEAFADVKAASYKHVYSFTSHIAVYDGCPTQYKYYKEYGFAQNRMFHTSVGSLVHATLEDMNKCVIAGRQDRVNERAIEEWFSLNYKSMQEQTGYFLTDEQRENALQQVMRYYHHRKEELGRVWKAEEEIFLVLPDHILQGVIDLIEGQGDTVEIVDYKTGPKPDVEGYPERVEHYRKQLEVYAYLVEKRYGKKVRRMHLYYTNCEDGGPLITFEWSRAAIDRTVAEISETIRNIESKKFDGKATNSYACVYCDMRYVCGKA